MHTVNGCVVIDENDLGKSELQILVDLIYESQGKRIPLEYISYKTPQALDQRPDIKWDANTYIPFTIDPRYDDRYALPKNSGFMYRRRDFADYFKDIEFEVTIDHFPFYVLDVLDQINEHLPYPLTPDDVVNYKFTSRDEVAFDLIAAPGSLLWTGKTKIQMEPLDPIFFVLVPNPYLQGFTQYVNP